MGFETHPFNNLLNSLFVTLHLKECLYLCQREVFSVSQGDDLVESAEQLEGIAQDFPFVQTPANAGDDLGKEVQAIDVLKNVGLLVCDQDNVELVQRLINESHVVLLDSSMLGAGICQFWERCEQCLDPRTRDLTELARENGFPAARTYRSGEDDLESEVSFRAAVS